MVIVPFGKIFPTTSRFFLAYHRFLQYTVQKRGILCVQNINLDENSINSNPLLSPIQPSQLRALLLNVVIIIRYSKQFQIHNIELIYYIINWEVKKNTRLGIESGWGFAEVLSHPIYWIIAGNKNFTVEKIEISASMSLPGVNSFI